MPVQTQLQQRRGTAASWTSTNPTLAAGEIGFETDTGKFKIGNGSTAWAALAYSAGATAVTYLFNATSGQTTFSGADANGLTLAYTVGAEQVYLNGVLQVRGSDYTGTNGTSIVLASGALTSDVLNIIAYSAMTVTDTYTQAQADAKFVQQTTNFFAGKNHIINGDFGINQRSFTSTTTSGTYGFDRFFMFNADGTCTYSAQTFTAGTAPVAGYEATNFARLVTTGQTLSSAFSILIQRIEDVRTLANQTVTVSFWAKAATGTPKIAIELDQNFGNGGSTRVTSAVGQPTISTSWARYSATIAVPSISGKTIGASNYLSANLIVSAGADYNSRTGSLGIQSNTFDIWGVQVEAGSIATPFQTATGTIAGELAACQRYYTRNTATGNASSFFGLGTAISTTQIDVPIKLPTTMRVFPSAVDFATLRVTPDGNNSVLAVTALTLLGTTLNQDIATVRAVVSGATQFRPYFLSASADVTAYVGFSAEL
jgi:hypothetical protein